MEGCCLNTNLNSKKKPYASRHIPIIGHPNNTINIPPIKNPVAFNLCLWKKNLKVLSSPITNDNPAMNKIWNLDEKNTCTQFHMSAPWRTPYPHSGSAHHVQIQRGDRGLDPPWKSHVPSRLENVGPPLDPWKSIIFSVIEPLDPSVNCKISWGLKKSPNCFLTVGPGAPPPPPPEKNSWIRACAHFLKCIILWHCVVPGDWS